MSLADGESTKGSKVYAIKFLEIMTSCVDQQGAEIII
jgi:hypothetical protein